MHGCCAGKSLSHWSAQLSNCCVSLQLLRIILLH
ncbi:unnamed protein product [Blumeria hordei]|uniref:Uncharacterized protein n=1 Tax=Blumeria hordei TaxID=2867405 RepID=A0A383UNQ4_BLUHO|nr:unnamed protein product [Blumeria hordei]